MKQAPAFTIQRTELQNLLLHLRALSTDRPTVLTFCHVDISATKSVRFYATNLRQHLLFDTAAIPVTAGKMLLPTTKTLDITRELPTETNLTLKETKAGFIDIIPSDCNARFRLPTFDPKDYPQTPDVENSAWRQLPTEQLLDLIRGVAFATAHPKDNHAYNGIMEGLYLHSEDTAPPRLVAVATDGHRLAHTFAIPTNDHENEHETPLSLASIVPQRTAQTLLNVLKDQPTTSISEIKRNNDTHLIALRQPGVTLIAELLSGNYPEYKPLLKDNNAYTFKAQLNHHQLDKSVQRVARMTIPSEPGIDLVFHPDDNLQIKTENDNGSAEDQIDVEYLTPMPKAHTIRLNPAYLREGLKHMLHGPVQIHFDDGSPSAVCFVSEDTPDAKYLIMPMKVDKPAA